MPQEGFNQARLMKHITENRKETFFEFLLFSLGNLH